MPKSEMYETGRKIRLSLMGDAMAAAIPRGVFWVMLRLTLVHSGFILVIS